MKCEHEQAPNLLWFNCLCDLSLKVPMMHGATPATVSAATTSATSVPFATATTNQVCSFHAPSFSVSALTFQDLLLNLMTQISL